VKQPLRHLLEAGLGWLLAEVPERARLARIAFNTNDVAVVFRVDPDGKTGKYFGRMRTDCIALVEEVMPEATGCLRILRAAGHPDSVPVVVLHKGQTYTLLYDLKGLPAGCLN
jgi:hypothetical protein